MSAYVQEHRERFGVEPICKTLGVSASAYYQRASGQRSARQLEDERLLAVIREIHMKNYEEPVGCPTILSPSVRSSTARVSPEQIQTAADAPGPLVLLFHRRRSLA